MIYMFLSNNPSSGDINLSNLPCFQLISMIHVSKFMVPRALSDKTYLSLGLLSPLSFCFF